MDAMESFDYDGRQFICRSEQLSSGVFRAVVRHMFLPDGPVHTLILGSEVHDASEQALMQAKELAVEWALKHPHPSRGQI